MEKNNKPNIHDRKLRDRQREALPSENIMGDDSDVQIESREDAEQEPISIPSQRIMLAAVNKSKKIQLSVTVDDDVKQVADYVMDEFKWDKKNISKFINIVLINYLKSDPEIIELSNKNPKIKKIIDKL